MAKCIIESRYEEIRDRCLAEGKLWEDPDFLADNTSIGPNPIDFKARWMRPHEICQELGLKPEFLIDGGGRFDINQGYLGDCWMLASVASLTTSPRRFERVVPHDQTFKKDKYAGIFRFNFWKYGKWVEVLVDDRLPTVDGELVYVSSKQPNEFWGPLLEKAYAKFYGNYQIIEGGLCEDALVDFTGCLAQSIYLQQCTPKVLGAILFPAAERQCIISACVDEPESAAKKGLVTGHAYSVTCVKKITLEDKVPRNLIRIRNPHGDDSEWKGRWSDSSEEWEKIPSKTREELGLVKNDDGEFWIQFSDFLRNFQTLEICYLEATDVFDGPGTPKCWSTSLFYGKWIKNETAGGLDVTSSSFAKNPQFAITISDHDEDDDEMASFVVELTQMNRRRQMLENLKIGFYVYQIPPETKLPLGQDFFDQNEYSGGEDDYDYARAVATNFTKEPGTYVIIPTTEKEGEEGEFMLRVFSESDHKSHAINVCCDH